LNAASQGIFWATILGADDFDVQDIDITTIRLGGASPLRAKIHDTISPGCNEADDGDVVPADAKRLNDGDPGQNDRHAPTAISKDNSGDQDAEGVDVKNGPDCPCMFGGEDYSGICTATRNERDGFDDLSLKLSTPDVIRAVGAFSPGEIIAVTLTGNLHNGTPFEASDCVRVVGKPKFEMISTPDLPTGLQQTWPGAHETYCTDGAASSEGHVLEYQFDFDADGANNMSAWADSACAPTDWPGVGTFVVKARARCAVHPDVLSAWSEGLTVTVSEVTQLPQIHFTTSITKIINYTTKVTTTKPYDPAVLDTVGMFRPFVISYHGTTVNGQVRAYRYFSMTPGVTLAGENVWSTDVTDTLRVFPNKGSDVIPSGVFRLGVQCRDDAGAESPVDAGTFSEGVCQLMVNYDPDTEMFMVWNTYWVGGQQFTETVDFTDGIPDTVPYQSWITLFYYGVDSPYDSTLCQDWVNECLKYQVQYTRDSDRIPGARASSRWLPDDGEDSNPFGTSDSTSMNVGSLEYVMRARTIDEYGRPDGRPAEINIVGNFDPTLDSYAIRRHDGHVVSDGDTLVWDWAHPAREGFNFDDVTNPLRVKEFYFIIAATGHDHPKERTGSGVKSWRYGFQREDDPSISQPFARSGFWVDGLATNTLSDTFRVVFEYPLLDTNGDAVFDNLPPWMNKGYEFSVTGRDTRTFLEDFRQYIFLNSQKTLLNVYPASQLGRWTQEGRMRFYLTIRRDATAASAHRAGFAE
jgi:hypothetical protein